MVNETGFQLKVITLNCLSHDCCDIEIVQQTCFRLFMKVCLLLE